MSQRFLVGVADYLTENEQELKILADIADVKLLGAQTEEPPSPGGRHLRRGSSSITPPGSRKKRSPP